MYDIHFKISESAIYLSRSSNPSHVCICRRSDCEELEQVPFSMAHSELTQFYGLVKSTESLLAHLFSWQLLPTYNVHMNWLECVRLSERVEAANGCKMYVTSFILRVQVSKFCNQSEVAAFIQDQVIYFYPV